MSPTARRRDGESSSSASSGAESDRTVCTPCRGTGRVISNLGGKEHELQCPWCGGSGNFEQGRDAQQFPAELGK